MLMDLLLASYNLVSTVNFPTRSQNRSATAIDNIFIDVSLQGNYVIHPLLNGLSDHDAQLIILSEVKTYTKNGSVKGKKMIRKIEQATIQDFEYKLSFETWDSVFGTNDINIMYNSFLNSFLRIFYSSFP
jgi:hypothetical protein